MEKSLREHIYESRKKNVAIGHFNVSNLEAVHAIVSAAAKLQVPVILGVTESEEKFFGLEEIVAVVKVLKEKSSIPIYLNADHHYSFESVQKALDAGFDMAIIDQAHESYEKNIETTKKCVAYAKTIKEKIGKDVLIEAELGFIGQSSKILESIPEGVSLDTMTKPDIALEFVEKTGIDLLAPSVGNIHGMVKTGEPNLHPDIVKQISDATGLPLVLHGASGNTDSDIQECIKNGVAIVHINTEIRVAFKEGLIDSLKNTTEIAPYKYLPEAVLAIEEVVLKKLKVFNFINQ